MSLAAPRPCTHPGCPRLVAKGACVVHVALEQRQFDQRRGSAHSRGYGKDWGAAREAYLRARPLCATCGHPANEVDHIIPHRGDMVLFWDTSNWQSQCKPCHSYKTVTEDGGFGRVVKSR